MNSQEKCHRTPAKVLRCWPAMRRISMFLNQGRKKQHKHKLFGPDFPRTFVTLMPGCPGVTKFLPTTGAAGKRTFWCGRPRFSARTSMTQRVVEKLCTKKVCVDFWPLSIRSRPGKPNQRKGQNEKFMNFAHFCEFWCFSLGNKHDSH